MTTTPLQRFESAPLLRMDIEGTSLAYRRIGRGPALLLVHGWPVSGRTFSGLVDVLRADFSCIVPDLPGAGESEWDPSIQELFRGFAGLVCRFAERLELDQFALLGHDSGAAVARLVAAEMPSRVRALALTNTEVPGHAPWVVRLLQRVARLPGAAGVFRVLLRSPTFLRSWLGFGGVFEDLDFIHGEFHQTCIAPMIRDPSGALATLRCADLGIVHELEQLHARISAPLLCVWGDQDLFFPLEKARAMVESWPMAARLETILGKKLFVHEEAPLEVARLMRPFLLEHLRPRPASGLAA